MSSILVVYATKNGSTREVAEAVAATLACARRHEAHSAEGPKPSWSGRGPKTAGAGTSPGLCRVARGRSRLQPLSSRASRCDPVRRIRALIAPMTTQ
jgi:hypothetical protein